MRLVRIGRPRTLCLLGGDSKSAAVYVIHSVHLISSFSRRKDASDAMGMVQGMKVTYFVVDVDALSTSTTMRVLKKFGKRSRNGPNALVSRPSWPLRAWPVQSSRPSKAAAQQF